MNKDFKIIMLSSGGASSRIMYNALENDFNIERVIIEKPISKKILLRNRIKRLGYLKVFGQLAFMLFNKISIKFAKSRIKEIKNLYNLNDHTISSEIVSHVESINDNAVVEIIKKIEPDAIIVNGTRIISNEILSSIKKPFINTHVGITPKYRGVHGGYWALVNDDIEHCGVTVHLVDTGVDTGEVLYQDTIAITKADSFNTYPYLQIAKAIPLMKKALTNVQDRTLKPYSIDLPSALLYHPTLYEYMKNRLIKKVK